MDADRPPARIDMPENRAPEFRVAVGDVVRAAPASTVDVSIGDRFQVISEHERTPIVIDPQYLGIGRSAVAVIIQVTLSEGDSMLWTLLSATILAGALAGSAMAQAPDDGCALPSEPTGIPAAFDAVVSGPADRDRGCMKALLAPQARIISVSLGADGAPSYTVLTLDDWIARTKARGHAVLEERQLKIDLEHYGNIAHLWSSYVLHIDGKQVARGINSMQAIREAGGWRVMGIMFQAESAAMPLAREYLSYRDATPGTEMRDGPAARTSGRAAAL